ncbi:MAG: insulinase family protein [Bacteroidetes bacterium]|nr:insulinase family protein [Bacteroidota bacterium]
MKKALKLVAVTALVAGNIFAQGTGTTLIEKAEAKADGLIIPYEKYKLSNGLTIIVNEDHSDPKAYVAVTYKVGSNRETIGKTGFAHLFEHMLFQGSKHVKDEQHEKIIVDAGGQMNGNTNFDRTHYFEVLPSNNVEAAMWLEADRMGYFLDSLTSRKFEIQRDAVKNEKGQGDNRPYGLVAEMLFQNLFPYKHPYSWLPIGYIEDLNRVQVEDVRNFFLRWYGPNNAILTVAGDVDTKQVVAWAEKYFGNFKQCPPVTKMKPNSPILPTNKYASYRDNVYLPITIRALPTVPQYHKDEPALNLLADMMGGGEASIMYKKFVKSEKALSVSVVAENLELAGFFQVEVDCYAPDDLLNPNLDKLFNDNESLLKETFEEFEKTGITDEALQRSKAKKETGIIASIQDIEDKAQILIDWERLASKGYNLQDELDRYKNVTKDDITRVFNKYIKGAGAAVINVYPNYTDKKDTIKSVNPYLNVTVDDSKEYANLKYEPATEKFDWYKVPTPSASKTPPVPDFYQKTLTNGLKMTGTKYSETPTVEIVIEIDGGDLVLKDSKKIGLAALTSAVISEGSTVKYKSDDFVKELEKLGSYVSVSADKEKTYVSLFCLKKNLDASLVLLEERLFNTVFDEKEFKRIRKQFKQSLRSQNDDPNQMAQKAFDNIVYGNSIYGSHATAKSISGLEFADVKEYYNSYYSPSVSNLVIVGDITEAEILPKLEFLNKWKAKEVKVQPTVDLPVLKESQVYIVDKPFAKQSVFAMGHYSLPYDATGDYFKNTVSTFAFGGGMLNSRLNLNLREAKGYTYGIYGGFGATKHIGEFAINASIKRFNTGDALVEINKELNNYVNNGPTEEEVSFTKNAYFNGQSIKYETSGQKARFLLNIANYNLPKDYTKTQMEILNKMTREDMAQQVKKFVKPNNMAIVIVGDKEYVKKQLDKVDLGKTKVTVSNMKFE